MGYFISKCCCIPDTIRLKFLENKKYSFPFKTYKVYVQEVIDGDTYHITFFIKSTPITLKLRVWGVDTPELSSKNLVEKQAAIKVKNILVKRIEGKYVKCELMKWDKYGGRVVGKMFLDDQSLTDVLLSYNLGKVYKGATKEDWKNNELKNMMKVNYEKIKW
jgi:endonuclease YncB( thermonuclease family)